IVIREDSYNPFVTKTSESLIADDESSGYNNTREKDEDYFKKQQEILQEMDQTFDSNDDTSVQNYENKASDDYYDVNDIKGTKSKDPKRRIPYMEIVGQVHGTYIISQNEFGMYMIDQHAAQERIKYEYFRDKIGEVTNEVQDLLIPLTFHFSKDKQLVIDQYKNE
ncbi:DNA mismatch repair protein, partial [Escherichia coli]|nr:DNA mismatch repair protein [Escherichia coli]